MSLAVPPASWGPCFQAHRMVSFEGGVPAWRPDAELPLQILGAVIEKDGLHISRPNGPSEAPAKPWCPEGVLGSWLRALPAALSFVPSCYNLLESRFFHLGLLHVVFVTADLRCLTAGP